MRFMEERLEIKKIIKRELTIQPTKIENNIKKNFLA